MLLVLLLVAGCEVERRAWGRGEAVFKGERGKRIKSLDDFHAVKGVHLSMLAVVVWVPSWRKEEMEGGSQLIQEDFYLSRRQVDNCFRNGKIIPVNAELLPHVIARRRPQNPRQRPKAPRPL
jgi:hypothetical protein